MICIINIFTPSLNNWDGHPKWMKAMLYFERITEQSEETRQHYNYGVLGKECRDDIQTKYLLPLIKYQCNRNKEEEKANDETDEKPRKEEKYIFKLFAHFCDHRKTINLSCIDKETQDMHNDLKEILFDKIDDNDHVYEINKLIFPRLKSCTNWGEKVPKML